MQWIGKIFRSDFNIIIRFFFNFWQKYFAASHMIIINGANALQSFFAITGFLIAIQFMDLREKYKFKFGFFWKAVFYRYLR